MNLKPFNPYEFKNKNQVFIRVNNYPGICYIWQWSSKKIRYEKKSEGIRYYAYKKILGRQYSKSFESFEGAKNWRESSKIFDEPKVTLMTFRAVKEKFFDFKKTKVRPSTFETYQSNSGHLKFFNDIPMREINSKAVDIWLSTIKKKDYLALQHSSRITYRHELQLLRQICLYYSEYIDDLYLIPIKKRHIEDSIVDLQKYELMKAKNRTRYIPRNEVELFLAEIDTESSKDQSNFVYAVLAHFQLRTGCRIGECAALRYEDIDWDSNGAVISKTVYWKRKKGSITSISPFTKNGEVRKIYIPETAINKLKDWMIKSNRTKGLVFSQNGITPLSYRSIQYHYNNCFEALGLEWRSTHIMRHSFSTDFLEHTGDKEALRGQLGHKTSAQTDHYAKITSSKVQSGIKSYEQSLVPRLQLINNEQKLSVQLDKAGYFEEKQIES